MNPMLQRHCAKFIYIVPDGLRELMSDISREVIREQPEQVYTYVADYLDALMITRENARIAAKLVDSICEIAETTVGLLQRIGLSRDEANETVAVIQIAFRAYLDKMKKYEHSVEMAGEFEDDEKITQKIIRQLNIDPEKIGEACTIIQTAWRNFKERREREKRMLCGMVDWRIAAKSAIMLYRKTGVTMYEANRAATLIKAAYKGYYTRRIMKRLLQMGLDQDSIAIDSAISEIDQYHSELGELPEYYSGMFSFDEEISSTSVGEYPEVDGERHALDDKKSHRKHHATGHHTKHPETSTSVSPTSSTTKRSKPRSASKGSGHGSSKNALPSTSADFLSPDDLPHLHSEGEGMTDVTDDTSKIIPGSIADQEETDGGESPHDEDEAGDQGAEVQPSEPTEEEADAEPVQEAGESKEEAVAEEAAVAESQQVETEAVEAAVAGAPTGDETEKNDADSEKTDTEGGD